jgi:hypothetical protein
VPGDGRHGERQPRHEENVGRGMGEHLREDQDHTRTGQCYVLDGRPRGLPMHFIPGFVVLRSGRRAGSPGTHHMPSTTHVGAAVYVGVRVIRAGTMIVAKPPEGMRIVAPVPDSAHEQVDAPAVM